MIWAELNDLCPLFHNLNVTRAGNFNGYNSPNWGDSGIWVSQKTVDFLSAESSYSIAADCFHVGIEGLVLPEFWMNG